MPSIWSRVPWLSHWCHLYQYFSVIKPDLPTPGDWNHSYLRLCMPRCKLYPVPSSRAITPITWNDDSVPMVTKDCRCGNNSSRDSSWFICYFIVCLHHWICGVELCMCIILGAFPWEWVPGESCLFQAPCCPEWSLPPCRGSSMALWPAKSS